MKRFLLVVLSTAALACGGDDEGSSKAPLDADYAGNFVDDWIGEMVMTSGGESSSAVDILVPISATGYNTLLLGGICTETVGANATVTGPSTFDVTPKTCPPVPVTGCTAVTFKYTSGHGSVVNDALVLNLVGTMSGCSRSFPFSIRYEGAPYTSATALHAFALRAASASFAAGASTIRF
jgi:hypothetical protein